MAIRQSQAILNKEGTLAACREAIEALGEQKSDPEACRSAVHPILTEALAIGTEVIHQRFMMNPDGVAPLKERCWLVDNIIKLTIQIGCECVGIRNSHLSVLATGGYGRKELFFHSDIDILVLVRNSAWGEDTENKELVLESATEKLLNFILYLLWDIGLKMGHSVRSIDQAVSDSAEDYHLRTSLIEARFVAGDRKLSNLFFRNFKDNVVRGTQREFIIAKLEEWRKRHEKLGDSRYVLEPNVKEGKGGLRDLHNLMWLANYCFDAKRMQDLLSLERISAKELNDFRRARKFLQLVRMHLHDFAGRGEENLTFDAQIEIAQRLQYRGESTNESVERFMKRYFLTVKTVGRLTRNFNFMLEEEFHSPGQLALPLKIDLPNGFRLQSGRLHFVAQDILVQNPVFMIEVFCLSHLHGREIHPQAWQWITRNLRLIKSEVKSDKRANSLFMEMLCSERNPEAALRRMSESGVLGRFIPDFRRIVGQMQFDLYHTYTVDEHTIFAIGILHRIEQGEFSKDFPLLKEMVTNIEQRRALYLALLCHDIAKGRRGDHSEVGARIVKKLGRRLELDKAQIETAQWLVKQHLLLAMTAFKRDLQDPKTIEAFVNEVRSMQRLRLLVLLTSADIRAVGPNIWNSWKGSLIKELYQRAERALRNTKALALTSPEQLYQQLREKLPATKQELIKNYVEGSEGVYLDAYSTDTHVKILPLWQSVLNGSSFAVTFEDDKEQLITEVTVAAPDTHGLFATVAGVIALCGANIMHARIATRKDGVAIDRFGIQDQQGHSFSEERRQQRIVERLEAALSGALAINERLKDQEQRITSAIESFDVAPAVFIDNKASIRHTIIEIRCLDHRGLLFKTAHCLSALGLNITSAHISTYGEEAVDVFYVKDEYGLKLEGVQKINSVKQSLMKLLEQWA